ncbi:MAG: 50S ribosomal protein L24 [Alphaproteobacteria bacterium]|nr:50S ribosomal protein L24 [Alphaproteobacteria bacterium]MCL2504787.1 50S ribosomal protein L24 [Alphaproteobacteria bacterium]
MKIKKTDKVIVITGKYKGKVGEVLSVYPKEQRVVVSGVNMIARHTKPSQVNPSGGIVRKEAPVHISNVAIVDPSTGKAAKVGYKIEGGVKKRIARGSKTEV